MTDVPRRFVFHGAACAFSGRVYRPKEAAEIIASPASSAISVSGGLSRAEFKTRKRVGRWLSVGSAVTHAEGNFDNLKQAIEMTRHLVDEDTLTTTTRVSSALSQIDISLEDPHPEPRFRHDDAHHEFHLVARAVKATLVSSSPKDPAGPPIALGKDTDIAGLEIDGYPLTVKINHQLFGEAATYGAFVDRAGKGDASLAEQGAPFFVNTAGRGGPIETTVIRELKWTKRKHPTATIEKNRIHIPNFGWLFLGELFISQDARRLTMMRLVFGSHTGFHIGFGDVHTDGSWYPP